MGEIGPCRKRLIIEKMSRDAIPDREGLAAAVKLLTTPGGIAAGWREAANWVDAAIIAIREAADPNPWRNSSDEDIADELLRKIASRRALKKQRKEG